jgi:maltose alpha-D-glucosyltransferase/alpha-amylase
MRAEQSNTSIRFGDAAIVKLIRRLQPGPNPDAEMLGALASVAFAHVPQFLGEASWRSPTNEEYPLLLVQAFVPNDGDGWSWMLNRLAAIAAGEIERDVEMRAEQLLGRRTGELHVALSQLTSPEFAPEPVSEKQVTREMERIADEADDAVAMLEGADAAVQALLKEPLEVVTGRMRRQAAAAVSGLHEEAGLPRIRVHGDFHLGQTLRTRDDDWMIIDFEGEPARPVAERRRKTSPLRDVAGMLRSFSYARGAAERALPSDDRSGPAQLAQWESAAREAFVAGYRAAVTAAPLPLVPSDNAAFARALAAWELEKAIYEIGYEVRNRPDWLDLPLRAFRSAGIA